MGLPLWVVTEQRRREDVARLEARLLAAEARRQQAEREILGLQRTLAALKD